jgi:hypothetical protein
MTDLVNAPPHYTQGRFETIDVIEDAVQHAPDPVSGFLQGQVLKYVSRAWLKDDPRQDLKKCMWYLMRLIDHVEASDVERDKAVRGLELAKQRWPNADWSAAELAVVRDYD